MNITRLNEIFARDGREVALASAKAAMMAGWIIQKLENGSWDPDYRKPEPESIEDVIGQPLVRMRPRVGKTARTGGLAAAEQRKRAKAAADRELRASMKGK